MLKIRINAWEQTLNPLSASFTKWLNTLKVYLSSFDYFAGLALKGLTQKNWRLQYCRLCLRSSHQKCSLKKGVLENFAKFIGKHLCQGLFFNKVEAFNFIKKETLTQVFSCEFCEVFNNTFLQNTSCCFLNFFKS